MDARKRGLLVGVFALCGLAWWLYLGAAGRTEARRATEAAPRVRGASGAVELATPELPPVDEPESTRVEQEPGEPEPSPARFEELGPDEALLQVRVLALGSGRPLAGAKLRLETPAGASLARAHRELSSGTPEESLESDAQGRADFRVRAGEPYVLHTQFELPPGRSARLDVRPVEPGQYRTVVAHVFATTDRIWYAGVLDGVDGRPVPEARAAVLRGKSNALAVPIAGDGGICLSLPASVDSLRVWAPGYAEVRTETEEGHQGAEVAQRIELLRLAALSVSVVDARGGALEGCTVQTTGFDDERFLAGRRQDEAAPGRGVSDAEGRCLLEALPPRVDFTVSALHHGRKRLARLAEGLAPGELRELVLAFGGGSTLVGRVVDQEGVALGGLELCLLPGRGAGVLEWDVSGEALWTKSDEQGRFVFEDVAPGDWRLGPRSGRAVRLGGEILLMQSGSDASALAVAPLSRAVLVPEGEARMEVALEVWRGLFIRGRVVGGELGLGFGPDLVLASSGELSVSALCHEDAFELGPLVPGEYELTLSTRSGWRSRPLRVAAGTSGVELVLEPPTR